MALATLSSSALITPVRREPLKKTPSDVRPLWMVSLALSVTTLLRVRCPSARRSMCAISSAVTKPLYSTTRGSHDRISVTNLLPALPPLR